MKLDTYLASRRGLVDAALEQFVPPERDYPETIHRAMRHSLFSGGKRIRPILAIAAAEAIGSDVGAVERPACALELVHTYSLIHDDLPALDNDDFRRGRPTCHKVFGDAMAILAGDALLTLAFQVLSELDDVPSERRIRMVAELAAGAGTVNGMIGGQVADIEAEGKQVDAARLEYIHRSKDRSAHSGVGSDRRDLCGCERRAVRGTERLRNAHRPRFPDRRRHPGCCRIDRDTGKDGRQGCRPAESDIPGPLRSDRLPRTREAASCSRSGGAGADRGRLGPLAGDRRTYHHQKCVKLLTHETTSE